MIFHRYPTNPSLDTTALFSRGCDAVVFLVFNQFAADCETPVDGHKYAGVNKVGHLENEQKIFWKIPKPLIFDHKH